MKYGCIIITITILMISVIISVFIWLHANKTSPPLITKEEQQIKNELKYNQTHGHIVRIEVGEFTAELYDSTISDWIVVRDYSYVINLLNGNATIHVTKNARLQLYKVGDFVKLDGCGNIKLVSVENNEIQ